MILLQILVCILIADFLSGLFHWLEDSYGKQDWLITGELITKPNILHHHNPRHFINAPWFARNRVLLFLGVNTLLFSLLLHSFGWQIFVISSVGMSANEIHRWAHQTPQENGRVIHFLQQVGILQSCSHHAFHHQGQKNSHYCVITDWLNPLRDALGLWRFIETLITKIFGIYPRLNQSINLCELHP